MLASLLKIRSLYFISSYCDDATYQKAIEAFHGVGHAVQKYYKLLLEGFLRADESLSIRAISAIPKLQPKLLADLQRTFHGGRLSISYMPCVKNNAFRQLLMAAGSFFFVLAAPSDTIVISDILKISVSLGAYAAAKIRKFPLVAIVTDLPMHMDFAANSLMLKIDEYIATRQDYYVLLAERMNEIINPLHKPFIVAEGQVDISEREKQDVERKAPAEKIICLYAGSLHRRYGIGLLISAFLKIASNVEELHIYGDGDMADEIREIAGVRSCIRFFGSRPNDEIVQAEKKAALLINPRPSGQEFTMYSFPSKNLEYMVSGQPCLVTRLPAIPREYDPYVYYFEDETVDGMARSIRAVLDTPACRLRERGLAAREYVLKEKSNVKQAKRILDLIGGGT